MAEIAFDPEVFNEIYRPYFGNKSRYEIYYGGAGSGKSDWIASKYLLRMMTEHKHKFLFCRKVARTIRHSQYALVQELAERWKVDNLFRFYDSTMDVVYLPTGSKIIAAGLDDVAKLKSVSGVTGIWIEEATELTKLDFDQLDLRMRGKRGYYKQMTLSFNPEDYDHWLRGQFFPEHLADLPSFTTTKYTEYGNIVTRVLRTTWRDNKFLDDLDRAKYSTMNETDKQFAAVYADGKWGTKVEGLIYTDYQIVPELPVRRDHIIYGVDYGFSNPTAVVNIIICEGEIYLDEVFYATQHTTADVIKAIRPDIPNPRYPMYADSAEPDRTKEIARAGFNIHAADKGPTVWRRIEFCKRFKIHVTARSVNIIKELKNYKRMQKSDGSFIDEPVPLNNHAMNAYEYGLYSHWRKYGDKLFGIQSKKTQSPKQLDTPNKARERRRSRDVLNNML